MKQCAKFQLIFHFIVVFCLFSSLPVQCQTKTVEEIGQKVEGVKKCMNDPLLDQLLRKIPFETRKCDFTGQLNANPGANVIIPEKEKKGIEKLKAKVDVLKERNDNLQKEKGKELLDDYQKAKKGILLDQQDAKELLIALFKAWGFDVSKIKEGDRKNFYEVNIVGFNALNIAEEYRGAFKVDSEKIDRLGVDYIIVSLVMIEGILHILLNKPDLNRIGIILIAGYHVFLRGMVEILTK